MAQPKTEGDTSILVIRKGWVNNPNMELRRVSFKDAVQEIQNQRVSFFTKAIDLSPEESEVFWPIYNQLTAKRNKLVEERKVIMKNCSTRRVAELTDGAAEEMLEKYISIQQQENALQLEYYKKFKAILPAKKNIASV